MSLSSLIVQREVATMRQVEEALARQVIYGGDLVTNLLEVARVDEALLTQLLAESVRLPAAPAGALPEVPARVRALVPADFAVHRSAVPLELTGEKRLALVVADPLPADAERELSLSLGMTLEQRAAPLVRIHQALAAAYGVPLDRRAQRLLARLSGEAASSFAPSLPPSLPPSVKPEPLRSIPVDLKPGRTGTPAFGTLATEAVVPLQDRLMPVPLVRRKTSGSFPAARLAPDAVPAMAPASAPPAAPPPAAPAPPPASLVATPRAVHAVTAPPPGARPPSERPEDLIIKRAPPAIARAGRRRRGPLTLADARKEADQASDRDGLLDLFFEFSRQFFDYAAIFLLHGDIAEGRDAFGDGAPRERVMGIGIPLDLPSLLAGARDQGAPQVARARPGGLDAVLLSDLGRAKDVEVAVVPLLVRRRAVAILVADCGKSGVDRASLQEVAKFAGVIGAAFERIIVRRKLDGFVPGGRDAAVGRVADGLVASKKVVTVPVPAGTAGAPVHTVETVRPPSRQAPLSTLPPPPSNVASVRKVSGPPIPREEPSAPALGRVATRRPPPDEPRPAPSTAAVSIPPHRPPAPSALAPSDGLPSVIVDVDAELCALVDKIVAVGAATPDDGTALIEPEELHEASQAEAELLRHGAQAVRAITSRFPGPVAFPAARVAAMANPPRASECGPLLRIVVRQREAAVPFLLERLAGGDPEGRAWAAYALGEAPGTEAISPLASRLGDADAVVASCAMHALKAAARIAPDAVRDSLVGLAHAVEESDRIAAVRAIARVRDTTLFPDLVRALGDGDDGVVQAAQQALCELSMQDFGSDARLWLKWWEQNGPRHRVEWLIDALTHEAAEIRRLAGDELRATTREYFGYSSDLPQRERERAQQRYRDWWIVDGRARFERERRA